MTEYVHVAFNRDEPRGEERRAFREPEYAAARKYAEENDVFLLLDVPVEGSA